MCTYDLNLRYQKGIGNKMAEKDIQEMTMQETIDRINALYHKSQNEGLTEEEKEEQKELRQKYILNVRRNLRGQLNNIDIQNEDGSVTNLGEKYGNKKLH